MKPRDAIFGLGMITSRLALATGSPTSHNLNINVSARAVDVVDQFQKLHDAIRSAKHDKTDLTLPAAPADSAPDLPSD